MTSPAREAALDALAAARRRGVYVAPLAEQAARRRSLDSADHAFCVLLAKGVTRTAGVLDDAIARHARLPRLEPLVLDTLRIGAFELLFLKTPAHAAVNEAVSLARRRVPRAARLVNAVLRRIAEEAPGFPWGDPGSDRDALARLYGVPRWMVDAFIADLGEHAARASLDAMSVEPPLFVRVNRLVAGRSDTLAELAACGIAVQPAPPDDLSFRVLDPASFVRSEALAADRAFVCDAAAQYVALQASAPSASLIVEVGAGRGTKTLALLGGLPFPRSGAEIVAIEPAEWRVRIWQERLARSGVRAASALIADVRAVEPSALPRPADVVLLDAPCTGTGTLRRHPEAVWRLAPSDAERLAAIQLEMLSAAASLVCLGGLLVYSTCSIARLENESVVAAFLASDAGSGFRVEPLDPEPPAEWAPFVTPDGFFRSWPTPDGPDGHFAARLRRLA